MRKMIAVVMAVCVLFSLAGCSALEDATAIVRPKEKVFSIDTYHLQITADTTFQEKTGGNSWDLQITNGDAYISVMAYKYIDLPQDVTPADVYDMQNQDIFSKRDNVATVEETMTQTLPGCKVTYGMYSAEKDGGKNYYASYLMDFADAETFAWVLVTAVPSYMEENKETLHNIVCSLTPAK